MEPWQLEFRRRLPLDIKIKMSLRRIKLYYDHFEGDVYVAFSGGKDSTVLLHLVRQIYPDVVGVYVNTGLEFPEINEFVQTIPNVVTIKPKMSFYQVIKDYGYPLISKEQAQYIRQYRTAKSEKTKTTRMEGNSYGRGKISEKWKFLVDAPFKISEQCCDIMKKRPSYAFEKKTGLHPILGVMADNSSKRHQDFLKYGCNAFESKRPISRPIGFWTDDDIWEYIKLYNLPYCNIYDKGYKNTGCVFCAFGIFQGNKKFELMEKTHPQLYKYCMEKLGLGEMIKYIEKRGEI